MATITDNIPIDLIDPDVNNPRIAEFILENPNPKPSQLFRMLGAAEPDTQSQSGTTYNTLKKSIESNGTLINRVLLGKYGDRYRVIEGNTRVAIYNDLLRESKDEKDKERWAKIPAEINNDINEEDEHKIRLQAHLVGVREWTPFAKGKYLYDLVENNKMTIDQIAGVCGDQNQKITLLIKAYKDFSDYYMPKAGQNMVPQRFSAFVEIQAPKRKQALARHNFTMDDFAQWNLSNNLLLRKNEHVRKLEAILDVPEAKRIFLQHGSDEAIKFLQQETPDLSQYSLMELAYAVNEKISKIDVRTEARYKRGPDNYDVVLMAIVDLYDVSKLFLDGIDYQFN